METLKISDLEESHNFGLEVGFVIALRHPSERTKAGLEPGLVLRKPQWGGRRCAGWGKTGEKQLPQRAPQWPDVLKRAQETCCPAEQREELGVAETESGNIRAPHIEPTLPPYPSY